MVSYTEASPNGKAVPNGWLFRMESYSMRSLSRENAEPNACGFVWLDLNSFHKIQTDFVDLGHRIWLDVSGSVWI